MLLHTFRNDEFMTRTTVHELNDTKGVYFRVVHTDTESGQVVGAVRRETEEAAMETAKQFARGEIQPGDMSPPFLPDFK